MRSVLDDELLHSELEIFIAQAMIEVKKNPYG
jgi:hypothetical protein